MTYIPQYYRPYYYQKSDELEKVVSPLKNKNDSIEKIEKKIIDFYNSSEVLSNLKYRDTNSLYDTLLRNGIELEPLYKSDYEKNSKLNDNEYMDIDDDSNDININDKENGVVPINPNAEIHNFIPLHEIKEGVELLIGISNIPSDILNYSSLIENLIDYIVKLIKEHIPYCKRKINNEEVSILSGYKWSFMGFKSSSIGTQTIYIRFDDAMMMYLFKKIIDSLNTSDAKIENKDIEKIKTVGDIKLEKIIFSKLTDLFILENDNLENHRENIIRHIDELMKIGHNFSLKNAPRDDYLTRFKRLAETYRIDPKDLTDVPSDMLDTVKQNILDFRLHVLTDLENKQKERMLQDKLEAQKQLGNAYLENKKSELKRNDELAYDKSHNKMSDIEFESMVQNKEKITIEKRYFIRLNQYKKREEIRLRNYKKFQMVTKHESYINKVIPANRDKFLENFVFNVKDEKNKIDLNFNYYTKHANYIQYRDKMKISEEKRDKLDEEEELKEEN